MAACAWRAQRLHTSSQKTIMVACRLLRGRVPPVGSVERPREMRAATRAASAVIIAAIIGGVFHQSGSDGEARVGCGGAGGGAGIVTFPPAPPMAGLPAPEVCWVIVVRGISVRRMTTISPIAAMMLGGCVHPLAIGRAFLCMEHECRSQTEGFGAV